MRLTLTIAAFIVALSIGVSSAQAGGRYSNTFSGSGSSDYRVRNIYGVHSSSGNLAGFRYGNTFNKLPTRPFGGRTSLPFGTIRSAASPGPSKAPPYQTNNIGSKDFSSYEEDPAKVLEHFYGN